MVGMGRTNEKYHTWLDICRRCSYYNTNNGIVGKREIRPVIDLIDIAEME